MKKKKKRNKHLDEPRNPIMKAVRALFIVNGSHTRHTFFSIGKKRFIHANYVSTQVFQILDLEKRELEISETHSNPNTLDALETKITDKMARHEFYQLPTDEDLNEFEDYYEKQEEQLTDEERLMVQLSLFFAALKIQMT